MTRRGQGCISWYQSQSSSACRVRAHRSDPPPVISSPRSHPPRRPPPPPAYRGSSRPRQHHHHPRRRRRAHHQSATSLHRRPPGARLRFYIDNRGFGGKNHSEHYKFCSFLTHLAQLDSRRGLQGTCSCVKSPGVDLFNWWVAKAGECPRTTVARRVLV